MNKCIKYALSNVLFIWCYVFCNIMQDLGHFSLSPAILTFINIKRNFKKKKIFNMFTFHRQKNCFSRESTKIADLCFRENQPHTCTHTCTHTFTYPHTYMHACMTHTHTPPTPSPQVVVGLKLWNVPVSVRGLQCKPFAFNIHSTTMAYYSTKC